jgi:hypothetical protein
MVAFQSRGRDYGGEQQVPLGVDDHQEKEAQLGA